MSKPYSFNCLILPISFCCRMSSFCRRIRSRDNPVEENQSQFDKHWFVQSSIFCVCLKAYFWARFHLQHAVIILTTARLPAPFFLLIFSLYSFNESPVYNYSKTALHAANHILTYIYQQCPIYCSTIFYALPILSDFPDVILCQFRQKICNSLVHILKKYTCRNIQSWLYLLKCRQHKFNSYSSLRACLGRPCILRMHLRHVLNFSNVNCDILCKEQNKLFVFGLKSSH